MKLTPTPKERKKKLRAWGRQRVRRRGLLPAKDDRVLWLEQRTRAIEKIVRSRCWITFAEVAEWLARDPGMLEPLSKRLPFASHELIEALRNGGLSPTGHAVAMLISPQEANGILSSKSEPALGDAMAQFDNDAEREEILWPEYFERTWMPLDQCVAWFKRNGWELKPAWEEGQTSSWQPRRKPSAGATERAAGMSEEVPIRRAEAPVAAAGALATSAATAKRGRPKGSGDQEAWKPFVEKVHALRLKDQNLRVGTACKIVIAEAKTDLPGGADNANRPIILARRYKAVFGRGLVDR